MWPGGEGRREKIETGLSVSSWSLFVYAEAGDLWAIYSSFDSLDYPSSGFYVTGECGSWEPSCSFTPLSKWIGSQGEQPLPPAVRWVFSIPRSDTRSFLCKILKYGNVIPTLKLPNACGRTSLFFMSSVNAVTRQMAPVSHFGNRMMPRMSSWVDFFHSRWSVKLTLFLNATNYVSLAFQGRVQHEVNTC